MGKLIYLEAIRGIAAMMVALHHFDLGITANNNYLIQLKNQYTILQQLIDGNLAVTMFFILSGRVLTLSFLKKELSLSSFENLSASVFKRSFRLVIPVLVVLFISQLLGYFKLHDAVHQANVIAGTSDWYQPPTEFSSFTEFLVFIVNIFTNTFYINNNDYYPFRIMWTIPLELYGSWVMYMAAIATVTLTHRLLFLVLLVIFNWYVSTWSCVFILGMLITECSIRGYLEQLQRLSFWAFRVLLFVLMYTAHRFLYAGGAYWSYLDYKYSRDLYQTGSGSIGDPGDLWYQPQDPRILLAVCIVLFVEVTPFLQQILNTRMFDFLGRVSFGLYLAHGVVLSAFISRILVALNSTGMQMDHIQIICFFAFWFLSFFFGWMVYKFVDIPAVKLSKQIPLHHYDLAVTLNYGFSYKLKDNYPLLHILLEGNLAVTVFFILSGRVLTLSVLKKGMTITSFESIASGIFRRSVRLLYPVITVTLFSQTLDYMGVYENTPEAKKITGSFWYNRPAKFQKFSEFVVYFVNLFTNAYYLDNLLYFPFKVIWTIPVELVGSWVMFLVAIVTISIPKKKLVFLGSMILMSWYINSWASTFITGMFIAECANRGYFEKWYKPQWVWIVRIILLISIFTSYKARDFWGIFSSLKYSRDIFSTSKGEVGRPSTQWYEPQDEKIVTALSIILLCEITPVVQEILNSDLFDFLGKISYGLYLGHGVVLLGVTSNLIVWLDHWDVNPDTRHFISFIVYWIATILLGWLIHKYADAPSVSLSHYVRQLYVSDLATNGSFWSYFSSRRNKKIVNSTFRYFIEKSERLFPKDDGYIPV
ncbi:hypothetical protein HDV01_006841 [Terramyces sp. JEL0728]|nr:hypothetical protein HDV01_006841 [Terramyces sp. JEL0728]